MSQNKVQTKVILDILRDGSVAITILDSKGRQLSKNRGRNIFEVTQLLYLLCGTDYIIEEAS